MTTLTILLIVLIILLFGALPSWPFSKKGWDYSGGGLCLVVVILMIRLVLGYL